MKKELFKKPNALDWAEKESNKTFVFDKRENWWRSHGKTGFLAE